MENTTRTLSGNKIEPANEIITRQNSAVTKRWKGKQAMINMIRKVSFQAESVIPVEAIGKKSKIQKTTESRIPADTKMTKAKARWKRASKLVTKRTRKMSVVRKFKLPSNTPTEVEMKRRSKYIERILLNNCHESVGILSFSSCFLGILLGIIFTVFLTTFPQHYPLGNPEYWYEPMLAHVIGWTPIAAIHLINVCHFCIGIRGRNTMRTCLIAYGVGSATTITLTGLFYFSWAYMGTMVYPMPFTGYILAVVTWYMMVLVFWFQCPKEWRSDSKSRKKMIFCIIFLNMLYVAEITYKVLRKSFLLIPKKHHWPLVFVLLIVREGNGWCLGYFGKKISGFSEDLSVDILATLIAGSRHIMFLSIEVGSITTDLVSYSILALDFIINIGDCILTIYYCKRNDNSKKNRDRQVKAVLALIINESVEILMPVAYVITLVMAYYGPNAEILGNIKNSEWQYSAIEDIGSTMKWMGLLFSVDIVSAVICVVLIYGFCKINILKMYLQVQNQLWYILAIEEAYILSEVRCHII